MRHIIPISGKDSLTVALIMKNRLPDLPYEYVFNPTGSELPEVFSWLERVEDFLGKPINRVGADLMEIIEGYNFFLPSQQSRYCTRQSKIEPFERWIGTDQATVYYGIRADEKRIGYQNSRYPNITPSNPLIELGIGINDVYRIVTEAGLKPPTFFWQRLYDQVCKILGGGNLIDQFIPEWQKDMLFAWRSRTNCYHCFNQRLYEWIGLLEHHPDLFWKAESMEGQGSECFWIGKKLSLKSLVERADLILSKRALQVARFIKAVQYGSNSLFTSPLPLDYDLVFSNTSCGLFCGK